MNELSLLIRADIGPTVGTGHVMRTAALASAWCNMGGAATIVCTADLPRSLRQRLERDGIVVEIMSAETPTDDAVQTARLAEETGATWIVADGYSFDDAYQETLKRSSAKLLVVDDFGHAEHHHADLLLNQNIYADRSDYGESKPESLLLGPRFVLMRDEFSSIETNKKRVPKTAKRIMVTMGGADQGNFTSTCLHAIADLPNNDTISVDVIVGASNDHYESLQQLCRELPNSVRLHRNTDRMATIIKQCDLAITAGGSTCYELARCGVPAIVLSTAENQIPVARSFHESGSMVWLGDSDSVPVQMLTTEIQKLVNDSALRKKMAAANRALVDGQGAKRIARRLLQEELVFREVVSEDSKQLWQWRNESTVREGAFQSEEISWTEHQIWFQRAMADRLVDIWIVETRAGESEPAEIRRPIGPVRLNFDSMGTQATISLSIAPEFRGRGWGTAVIEAACRRAFHSDDIQEIVAWIKPENRSSLAAFDSAGFIEENKSGPSHIAIHTVDDQPAIKMILRRNQVVPDNKVSRRSKSA